MAHFAARPRDPIDQTRNEIEPDLWPLFTRFPLAIGWVSCT